MGGGAVSVIGGRKLGVTFRRQVVIGDRYIVDFLASDVRMAVEVDGGCHRSRRRADARRDEKLRRLGYRVLRLEAEVVMREPERVLALVRAAVGGVRSPPLIPFRQGGH